MARRSVKRFTAQQKLKIVKEGLLPNIRVADLCRHYDIYPTDYYLSGLPDVYRKKCQGK
jgi:transposase-like protein